ncbi:MAG: DUF2220 family protein [Treponema sp.]|jgi:hypothetical protein|nr:DUF2220 family protein [Treponema sp.]
MTRWEERIAGVFAERFPRSAAAENLLGGSGDPCSENASGGRPFRLTAEQLFRDFETSPPDEKEAFLEAVELLEQRGLVRIRWVPRRKREALASLVFPDPAAFFALMGKASPAAVAAEARLVAAEAGHLKTGDTVSAPPAYTELFRFLAAAIKPVDAVRGIDAAAVRDMAKLTAFLADSGPGPGLTARALSIALYADSKRLESVLSLFGRLLSAAENRGVSVPDFSSLDRSFPETMLAGKLRFFFGGDVGRETKPMENAAGTIIGLPLAAITRIGKIAPLKEGGPAAPPSVLMVENKETFYALAGTPGTGYDAVLYAGGHPNRAVRALVGVLAGSGFTFYHAGDLDIDGILILQELMDMAGKPVTPVRMDRKTFERYRCYGRKLEASMLRRASLIRDAVRNLAGIGELIKLIEETGLGVEQEIIDSY